MLSTQGYNLIEIADHINHEKQGWTRETTVRWEGHKIRASIYRDSYDFQSRISVAVWSPLELKWNTVRTLSGSDHAYLPGAYTISGGGKPEGMKKIFHGTSDLVEELIAYAIEVLR